MGGSDRRDPEEPGAGGSPAWLADGSGWQLDHYEAAFAEMERCRAGGATPPLAESESTPADRLVSEPSGPEGAPRPDDRFDGFDGLAAIVEWPGFDGAPDDHLYGPAEPGAGGDTRRDAGGGPPGLGAFTDGDEDEEPWQRPRSLRVVGMVLATSLLLGVVGTTIGAVFGAGSPRAGSLTATVQSVGPAEEPPAAADGGAADRAGGPGAGPSGSRDARGATGTEAVTFSVAGEQGDDATLVCAGVLTDDGTVLGTWSKVVPLDPAGQGRQRVTVPIDRAAFDGSPADAVVQCTPEDATSVPAGTD